MQTKLNKMIEVVQYIHHHPGKQAKTIIEECGISEATFYRYLNDLYFHFKVEIKPKNGFHVLNYGYINKEML